MNSVLSDMMEISSYIDDIAVFSQSLEDHLKHLDQVLNAPFLDKEGFDPLKLKLRLRLLSNTHILSRKRICQLSRSL